MTRFTWSAAFLAVLAGLLISAAPAKSPNFPARIDLPVSPTGVGNRNYSAEGIATGRGHTFYLGNNSTDVTNIYSGGILVGDYLTGRTSVLVPGGLGRVTVGVFLDEHNRIWAAGGGTGKAYVFDASTGEELAPGGYDLALTTPRFINDVIVTDTAAYFTNTNGVQAVFKIPLGPGGELPPTNPSPVQTLMLTPGFPGSNGIDVLPDGDLIVVSLTNGNLYKVDPDTGAATQIVVDGTLLSGDGLVLQGSTVYYVENRAANNATQPGDIVVVQLSPDFTTGHIVMHVNSPDDPLSGPATADRFGHYLYVVRRNPPTVPATDRLNWVTQIVRPDREASD